jgi:glutamate dehydrogenase (NADP+)
MPAQKQVGFVDGGEGPKFANAKLQAVYESIAGRDAWQTEFLQAVEEVFETMEPVVNKHPDLLSVLERLCEPERAIQFRVPWIDDNGVARVNRGFRVQFSSAIGPYKGGLRFHPSVNLSVIKFLGFEQILKNSLTGLPMGGGKGGSDFDPKGKSDNEVMRFCQSFMTELQRHIGSNTDVPAGDIGVGGREIGYLYGQYKRLRNEYTGVLTGKAMAYGGSNIRPEATGYGCVYFGEYILQDQNDTYKGKRCVVSGSGNVAQYAVEKLIEYGAVVLTMSDSTGFIHEPEGFTTELLKQVMDIKNVKRASLATYKSPTGKFYPGQRPWGIGGKIDIAMPCATQNEIEFEDAKALVSSGCKIVCEGANMPSTNTAIAHYHDNSVIFAPAKAANAGGVAVSGLEMAQNAIRLQWSREEVDEQLKKIMKGIYDMSKAAAEEYGVPLQGGANIAGFLKVASAMKDQGVV